MGTASRLWNTERWWRWPLRVVLVYAVTVLVANLLVLGAVAGTRLAGAGDELRGDGVPAVGHLRRVDERVLAGAQPTDEDYRGLAALGVELVVDLRTGAADDPRPDDPAELADLGMGYVSIPVSDGHAPTPEEVARFVAAVRGTDGDVFVHCGGGVGRSTAMSHAYLAATGRDPGVASQLAVGPPTLEQIWYGWRVSPGDVDVASRPVAWVSRYVVDGPRTAISWLRARL